MMWLTDWFIDHFPLYNKFRTVASILVIAEFTMPLLAALALQKIVTTPDFFKLHSKAFFGSFGISIFFCLLGMMAPSVFGSGISQMEADMFAEYAAQGYDLSPLYASLQDARMAMVSADALRSFVFLVIGAALFWLYFKNILKKEALCGALLVVVLIDMYPVDKRYLNTKSFSMKPAMAQQTIEPRPVDLQILQDTAMNYRVMDLSRFGDAMPSYFHKCIGGYHAAKLTRYQDLIDRQISKNNVEVLNMLNAKYLVVDDTTTHINPEALGNGWLSTK